VNAMRYESGMPLVRKPPAAREGLGTQGLYARPSDASSSQRTHAIDAATGEALCQRPRSECQRLPLDWEEIPPAEQCPQCREVFTSK
jgi:hypothetical protein